MITRRPKSFWAFQRRCINGKFIFNLKNPFKAFFFEWIFIKSFTQFFVCTAKKRRRSQTVFAKQKCFDHENCGVLGRSPKVLFFVFFVCFCNTRCVYTVFNSHLICLAYYGIKLSIRLFVFYISVEGGNGTFRKP